MSDEAPAGDAQPHGDPSAAAQQYHWGQATDGYGDPHPLAALTEPSSARGASARAASAHTHSYGGVHGEAPQLASPPTTTWQPRADYQNQYQQPMPKQHGYQSYVQAADFTPMQQHQTAVVGNFLNSPAGQAQFGIPPHYVEGISVAPPSHHQRPYGGGSHWRAESEPRGGWQSYDPNWDPNQRSWNTSARASGAWGSSDWQSDRDRQWSGASDWRAQSADSWRSNRWERPAA